MLHWLLLHILTAALLAGLALALGRWRRLGPAARHALWLLVLLKLLTPPLLAWPWPLPAPSAAAPAPTPPAAQSDEPVTPPAADEPPPALADAPPDAAAEVEQEQAAPAAPAASPSPEAPPHPWLTWEGLAALAGAVWLLGGAFVAAVHLRRIDRLRRALVLSGAAPPELAALVGELAAALRMRPPTVRTLPGLSSPMVWGLAAPCLLWPRGLEESLSGAGLRAVLVHELAHLKRRDHWVGWLLLAGACVWWWLPLFGLVRRRLSQEAELACDAWVVAALPEARRAYAEALLEVCQRMSQAAPAAPAWGASGGRRDLERRLIMILRSRAPYRLTPCVLAGVGLLALLSVPAWTLGQNDAKDPPKPKAETPAADKAAEDYAAWVQGHLVAANFLGKPAAAAPADQDADAAREKKVADLEAKVKELLKELKALREGKTDPKPDVKNLELRLEFTDAKPAPTEIALTRTAYKLPAAKAEALAKFLTEHVKAPVLETKVDGDSLIVTTTPDYQHAVAQMVGLVAGKLPTAHASPKPDPYPLKPAGDPRTKSGQSPFGANGGRDEKPKGPGGPSVAPAAR